MGERERRGEERRSKFKHTVLASRVGRRAGRRRRRSLRVYAVRPDRWAVLFLDRFKSGYFATRAGRRRTFSAAPRYNSRRHHRVLAYVIGRRSSIIGSLSLSSSSRRPPVAANATAHARCRYCRCCPRRFVARA